VGRLGGVREGAVLIEDEHAGAIALPLSEIESGRLEVEFGKPRGSRKHP
jgi:hypothetical protein